MGLNCWYDCDGIEFGVVCISSLDDCFFYNYTVYRFKHLNERGISMHRDVTTNKMIEKTVDAFQQMAPVFTVLADENRQLIVMALGKYNQLNVKRLHELIPLSRPAISHHLKVLKQAGIIHSKKHGTENNYFLTIKETIEQVRQLCDLIETSCHLI